MSGHRNERKSLAYLPLLMMVVALSVFPIFWVVSISFKNANEWFAEPVHWLPQMPTLSNYEQALASEYGVRAVSNSLIIAFGSTALALSIGFPASYVISRYKTGKYGLFIEPLILRAAPPAAVAVPLLVFYSSLGLVDTTQGLAIVYAATTIFYVIWIIKPFIDAVPREVEEAAMIDGVPRWKLPFSLVLPMVAGGVVAAAIFVFVLNWTEFILALDLTRFNARTIPLQMAVFSDMGVSTSLGQGQSAALSVVSLLPLMFVAYYLQKQLTRAFIVGAVRR